MFIFVREAIPMLVSTKGRYALRVMLELAQSDSDEFIERTARREYGYCWYGETVYEIGNLEELLAQEAQYN